MTIVNFYLIGNEQFIRDGDMWHKVSYVTAFEVLLKALQDPDPSPETIGTIISTPCFVPVLCEGRVYLMYSPRKTHGVVDWAEVPTADISPENFIQVEGVHLEIVQEVKRWPF